MHTPVGPLGSSRSTACAGWARAATLMFALVLVVGCAAPAVTQTEGGSGAQAVDIAPEAQASIDGNEVVLLVDGEHVRHPVPSDEGEPVYATVRPGAHRDQTVLVVTRVEDADGVRYELRYIVANADEVSDLYWFPWRLQISHQLAAIADVAPLPVWEPDGEALAWVEWGEAGTQVRTVGWIDDGISNNPSDEVGRYPVPDLPAGVQLERWETDDAGAAILVGAREGQRYRVELPTATAANT